MRIKWVVTRDAAQDFGDVSVYRVRRSDWPEHKSITVWWSAHRNKASCTSCQGLLSAMLSSCVHAKVVRRLRQVA